MVQAGRAEKKNVHAHTMQCNVTKTMKQQNAEFTWNYKINKPR